MAHVLGDHNRPIVELYLAEFESEGHHIILECWSMEPVEAELAFMRFFGPEGLGSGRLADQTRLVEHDPSSDAWRENREWWQGKVVWTGDYLELAIRPGTRMTIGKTIIEYRNSSYVTWSEAYPSLREKVTLAAGDSLRTHAVQHRIWHRDST